MKLGIIYAVAVSFLFVGCGDDNKRGNSIALPSNASSEIADTIKRINEIQALYQKKSDEILKPHGLQVSMGISKLEVFDSAAEPTLNNLKSAQAKFSLELLGNSDLKKIQDLEKAGMKNLATDFKFESDASRKAKVEIKSGLTANILELVSLSNNKVRPTNITELAAVMGIAALELNAKARSEGKNTQITISQSGNSIKGSGYFAVDSASTAKVESITTLNRSDVTITYELGNILEKFPILKSSKYLNAEKAFLSSFRSADMAQIETEVDKTLKELVESLRS